jgi:hypothetical protein
MKELIKKNTAIPSPDYPQSKTKILFFVLPKVVNNLSQKMKFIF